MVFDKLRLISVFKIVIKRINKLFEETIRGTATEVLAHYTAKPPKGEIVVIVDGKK
jgi:16S rRNA (cytidine1402-2'-O)-methyltransferase